MADQALQGNQSLQNLFASLRPSSSRIPSSSTPGNDSAAFTAPASRPYSEHPPNFEPSSNMSMPPPAGQPGLSNPAPGTPSRQSSADLISLLRQTAAGSPAITQQQQQQQSYAQPASPSSRPAFASNQPSFLSQNIHGRGVSSSDLVASFMGKPTISPSPGNATPSMAPESHSSSVHPQPQDYLLQLLNRTSSSHPYPPRSVKKQAAKNASDEDVADTPVVEEKPLIPAEAKEKKMKEIRYYRHKLQRGFLSGDDALDNEEITLMSEYLSRLERYPDLEGEILRVTKIHKVLKAMIRLDSIPKDDEFNFKKRSIDLLTKWNNIFAENAASAGEGAGDKDDEKAEDKPAAMAPLPIRPASSALQGSAPSQKSNLTTQPPARHDSPIRHFGTDESKEPTPFEPDLPARLAQSPAEKSKESPFTYVNPFEQLVASSPLQKRSGNSTPQRDAPRLSRLASHDPRQKPEPPASLSRSASSGLNANGHEVLQSIEGPTPKRTKNERSDAEAMMNIGAPSADTETVAQALNMVGDQVNRQVEQALAEGDKGAGDVESEEEVKEQLQEAAAEIKEELGENGGMKALEEVLPAKMAAEVKEVIDEAADGDVDGDNSSADDDEGSEKAEERIEVPVYNFPMRPFVSLELHQKEPASLQFRQGTITDIARLKKEFDQIDRTLATASNNYIIYAMPKPGGFRVIRQDDGLDRQVFRETKDHIFNLAISNTAPNKKGSQLETCIATASSGKVYWAALSVEGDDNLPGANFEQHCLVFPPVPAHDDNTSGGQLKTRAKKSNRHPEFFAIGRGKTIQVVFPRHAQHSKFVGADRVVDTAGYFKDRTLKINMGKAGKDFAFSEDDSVIATLDKAGRVRFWDVQDLVNGSNGTASALAPIEVKVPLLTFPTALANEKSWPTSVMFVDKLKAYSRGAALRYVIVGMKQNHTLQLWDLGLGKAVQEINFPHEKESDAICSVAYHPASGMFVVGHPTRNSIYLIHLSAPKYNLQGMSQAKFIERLANKDSSLPKPESTAIMSGMREYNFSSKGQIRSVDLLPVSHEALTEKGDPSLFELYVMHSKGVTCLNIRKADLGWSEDMRVLSTRPAEGEGVVVVKELREILASTVSEPSSVNGEPISSGNIKPKKKITETTTPKTGEATPDIQLDPVAPVESALNGAAAASTEKGRRKKKANKDTSESVPPPAPVPPSANPTASSTALSKTTPQLSKDSSKPSESKVKREMSGSQQISLGVSPDFMDREVKKVCETIAKEFSEVLRGELDTLNRRIRDDKAALDAASTSKQENVLRAVSTALNDNVEKSLSRIITTTINQSVIPTIHNVTATTLRKEVPEWLSKHLLQTLPAQMQLALPEAVTKAIQTPNVQTFMSEQITTKISTHVEKQFSNSLQNTILPTFQSLITESLSKKVREVEQRTNEQTRLANVRHEEDTAKIDQLTRLVQACTETIHSMAASQAQFQAEILKTHQQTMQQRHHSVSSLGTRQEQDTPSKQAGGPVITPEQREIQQIDAAMNEGNFQQGTILWLQSTRQPQLFDEYFIRYDPLYLRDCSALVALSVIAALSTDLGSNMSERLHWLTTILNLIDPNDTEIHEVAPRIMDVLRTRLETRYMELSEANPNDPLLRPIPAMSRKAREISAIATHATYSSASVRS